MLFKGLLIATDPFHVVTHFSSQITHLRGQTHPSNLGPSSVNKTPQSFKESLLYISSMPS